MKITYILGNGFDIQIGLATKYKEFYRYYTKQPSDNHHVEQIKSNISSYQNDKKKESDGNINWGDLEIALGEYTAVIESATDFEVILDDITNHLKDYLESEISKLSVSPKQLKKFWSDFTAPNKYFSNATTINNFPTIDKTSIETIDVKVVSFNYTNTVEELMKGTMKHMDDFGEGVNIINNHPILHIHSTVDDIILGLNDKYQIKNKALQEDDDFVNSIVKPVINNEIRNKEIDEIIHQIQQTNLFVIFGASLGPTDSYWAQYIGRRLIQSDAQLVYFTVDKEGSSKLSRKKCKANKRQKRELMEKLSVRNHLHYNYAKVNPITGDETEDIGPQELFMIQQDFEKVEKQIFIECNSDLFRIKDI